MGGKQEENRTVLWAFRRIHAVLLSLKFAFVKKRINLLFFLLRTKKGIKCVNVVNAMEKGEKPENEINVFFVKLSDDFNDKHNPEAQERVKRISEFIDQYGDKFVVIEPFDVVAPFMDRKLLHKTLMKAFDGDKKPMFRMVPSLEVETNLSKDDFSTTIEENKMVFPISKQQILSFHQNHHLIFSKKKSC